MLQIKSIRLFFFKNYLQRDFSFDKLIVGITGPNGAGKTNLLDAIYYLGFTKSYFNAKERQNANHERDSFRVEGIFLKNGKEETVNCVYKNGKKEVQINKDAYERFSHHIGLFPIVFIVPDDSVLITGSSELRRKFLDVILSQLEPSYLEDLIAYQKIKAQRNSFLKNNEHEIPNPALMDVFDKQLMLHGQAIFESRERFLSSFEKKVQYYYQYLSGGKELVKIEYNTDLHKYGYGELLRNSRQQDYILRRTSRGVHRDDLEFLMDENPLKQVGSQGQKKSFVFALKLAQFEVLRAHKRFAPVLLLDDIFEKLDAQRIKRLIDLICGEGFGQVFITDTEAERLKDIFEEADVQLQMITLE